MWASEARVSEALAVCLSQRAGCCTPAFGYLAKTWGPCGSHPGEVALCLQPPSCLVPAAELQR